MKRLSIFALALLCAACTGKYNDPWDNDPWGGGQSGGQEQEQGSGTAEETNPTSSGVTMDAEATSEDNVANTTFDGNITIVYNGSGATVSGSVEGVTVTKEGARVTVTNSGDKKVKYTLSGSSSDGFFKLYSDKKQAIVLSGLNLTDSKGAAINNQSKKRTFIVLEGTNTIADGSVDSSGDYPEQTDEEDMKAAIFSEGQLCFSGSGSLTVKATGKAGITSDDYVRFLTGSNVTVTSASGHGVRGKDAIIVSGGNVNVTVESTATARKCFSTDSLMFIGGGVTTLVNKCSAGTVDSELTGAAGIKADKLFVIQDGELSVTASGKGGKGISGDEKGFFEGGKVTVKVSGSNYGSSSGGGMGWGGQSSSSNSVSAKGIKFDGNLEFSGAEVTVSASSHEAIESKGTIYISGGTVGATSSDDAINSSSTMTISDGVVYACSSGNDGLDANGNMIIKGGTVYAVGCGSPEVAIDANTESRYKFYLQGGNVIALGGIESGSSVSQAVISSSWSRNTTYTLKGSDGSVMFTFKAPSTGGSGLFISAPSLVSGTSYTLSTGASVSGAKTYFDGVLSTGGTASGGSDSKVSASTYSSSGSTGGGGMGGGGRMW